MPIFRFLTGAAQMGGTSWWMFVFWWLACGVEEGDGARGFDHRRHGGGRKDRGRGALRVELPKDDDRGNEAQDCYHNRNHKH